MHLTESTNYGSTDSLTEIWHEFSVLLTMREAVAVLPHTNGDEPCQTRKPMVTVQRALERIEHWLQQAAWRAVGVPAKTPSELSFKIKIMGEYCDDDPDVLLQALASSIARDDVLV
ncbi:MAG: hypothetical protein ACR2PA_06155 [Hyphomicrobiaceae bacterium]